MGVSKQQLDHLIKLLKSIGFGAVLIDPNTMTPAEIAETLRKLEERAERQRLRDLGVDPDEPPENGSE